MSKVVKMVTTALVITVILTLGISSAAFASNYDSPEPEYSPGPAPSAGDGESEGPEWDVYRPDGSGPGPAPGSGDGINEGPEWPSE